MGYPVGYPSQGRWKLLGQPRLIFLGHERGILHSVFVSSFPHTVKSFRVCFRWILAKFTAKARLESFRREFLGIGRGAQFIRVTLGECTNVLCLGEQFFPLILVCRERVEIGRA